MGQRWGILPLMPRSNLPRDPQTGKLKAGPGRPAGKPNMMVRLIKDEVLEAYQRLGGVEALVKWIRASPSNKRDFYVTVLPRLIPAQALEAAAAHLAQNQRPPVVAIETLVVDPREPEVLSEAEW